MHFHVAASSAQRGCHSYLPRLRKHHHMDMQHGAIKMGDKAVPCGATCEHQPGSHATAATAATSCKSASTAPPASIATLPSTSPAGLNRQTVQAKLSHMRAVSIMQNASTAPAAAPHTDSSRQVTIVEALAKASVHTLAACARGTQVISSSSESSPRNSAVALTVSRRRPTDNAKRHRTETCQTEALHTRLC